MFSKQLLTGSLALAMIAVPADAQRRGWRNVSSATVQLGVTSETLRVRNADWLRQLRLCVDRRAVAIRDVTVNFSRGAAHRVSVRRVIRPGECSLSAPIRIPTFRGRNAEVRSVRVELTRLVGGVRPIISLQGR